MTATPRATPRPETAQKSPTKTCNNTPRNIRAAGRARDPWLKFYPTDWAGDKGLRLTSLAARGLWIECLCIMHEAEPYGHLKIGGAAVTVADLAQAVGAPLRTVSSALSELEAREVFSRDRNGIIYSRRMVRDHKKSREARANGLKGGNPSLCKTSETAAPDKAPPKPRPKRGDGGADGAADGGGLKPQKPEARGQRPDSLTSHCARPGLISSPGLTTSAWRARLLAMRSEGRAWWLEDLWGPPPGEPGCACPKALLAEFADVTGWLGRQPERDAVTGDAATGDAATGTAATGTAA